FYVAEGEWVDDLEQATILTTSDNDFIVLNNLLPGTYYLQEYSAPEGYGVYEGQIDFTLSDTGQLTTSSDIAIAATYNNTLVLAIGNSIPPTTPIDLEILKVDATDTSNVLEGAEFNLSYTEDGVTYYYNQLGGWTTNTSIIANITTNAAGQIYIANIMPGYNYTLVEKAAPAGYEVIEGSIEFTISEDGIITTESEYATAENGEPLLLIIEEPPSIPNTLDLQIIKVDADNPATTLQGAAFILANTGEDTSTYYVDGGTWTDNIADASTLTTDANGQITLTGIEPGSYALTETVAPSGYEPIQDPVDFVISQDGILSTTSDVAQAVSSPSLVLTIGNSPEIPPNTYAYDLMINKVDADHTDFPLEGAIFNLSYVEDGITYYLNVLGGWTTQDEEEIASLTTNADGQISLTDLYGGYIYTLTEVTAPTGYELIDSPVVFSLSEEGVITLVSGVADIENGEELAITVADNPTPPELTLIKQDADTQELLAYASFVLYTTDDGTNYYRTYADATTTDINDAIIYTTNAGGKLYIAGLLTGQDYYLLEVNAPSGYELIDDPIEFVINEDSSVTVESDSNIAFSDEDLTITVNNTQSGNPNPGGGSGKGGKSLSGTVKTTTSSSSSKGSSSYDKTGMDTRGITMLGLVMLGLAVVAGGYAYYQHKKNISSASRRARK
ncbi:MAG: hypothetical protein LUB61_05955, partial [Eggerthellaceae bacterium]|nr:hypothetical protein [Eggerthellaceae bacterium]